MSSSVSSRSDFVRTLWPWLPIWLLVSLAAIFAHGPMPLYSTRTLAVAWEMWDHQHWIVPYINGAPYSEKVPLLFWLIHLGWAAFGVGDVWPRLLEVLIGGTELVLVARMAHRLFPEAPWIARIAPWLLGSLSYAFLFGLQIMYDVLLAVWALAALLCLLPDERGRQEPRWLYFGLCLGLGLLTKGPVILLHASLPWLLGPLWSPWASQNRRRWYGRGLLALALGALVLLAWAIPAAISGGEAYRHKLFFTQTAGRVVGGMDQAARLQSHSRPLWWYLPWLPLLLFPLSGLPRVWLALGSLRRPLDSGSRFLLCWLLPSLLIFSLIRGKQLYYPLPEMAAAVLLISAALWRQAPQATARTSFWLGSGPLALAGVGTALGMVALSLMARHGHAGNSWYAPLMVDAIYFSPVFLLLALLVAWPGRWPLQRIALAGLLGTATIYGLFSYSLWSKFDLDQASALIAQAQARGQEVAQEGAYAGQFHFSGRLHQPITELYGQPALRQFARQHPDSLIITYPNKLNSLVVRYAVFTQPFRGGWLVIRPAAAMAEAAR
ncbi:ArnT family glycosyltransferase [Frateuria aurantia]